MKKFKLRILSAFMAIVLIMPLMMPAAEAYAADETGTDNAADASLSYPEGYTTVTISSVEDFEEFAENCHYDSWSADKVVVLTEDLDFTGIEFAPAAIFSGIFYGQGHTISGISITGYAAETGIFGTIQSAGCVYDLNVEAVIEPEGYPDTIGGIAGYNYGTISGCTFTGTITADSESGGIAGRNCGTGLIVSCTSSGTITASSGCGGITGYNEGTIISCTNEMDVNTTYQDTTPTLDDIDNALDEILQSGSIFNTGTLSSDSDIGGIAGFNSGAISSCTNMGDVGYEHVGYNVGGIAGRSSGYISGCANHGTIYGRKDVGGIVGQMQPYLLVSFSEDSLDELDDELDTLIDLVNAAMDNSEYYSSSVNNSLSNILSLAEEAQDAVENLTDDAADGAESAVSDAGEAIERLLEALSEANTDDDTSEYLDEMEQTLSDLLDSMESDADESDDSAEDVDEYLDEMEQTLSDLLDSLENGADADSEEDDSEEDTSEEDTSEEDTSEEDASEEDLSGDDSAEDASGSEDSEEETDAGEDAQAEETEAAAEETEASDEEETLSEEDIAQIYEDILASVSAQLSTASEEMQDDADSVYSALNDIFEEMEDLSDEMTSLSDTAQADLQAIIDQFDVVTDTLIDSVEELTQEDDSEDDETVVEDISDEDYESTYSGRTTGCVNYGEVNADVNTGGIAGILDVEYSLDPELDVETSGSTTMNYVLQGKCIIDNCINYGTITTKSSYAGGIAGHMEFGLVAHCESYGTLDSSGKYVGGIAGYSAGTIRNSAAKCAISGSSYIGGITGYGTVIYGNIAMVEIDEYDQYAGAISGQVSAVDASDIYENYYYSNSVYGINGVSYAGIAEGVSYAELIALDGVPDAFDDMVLLFYADDVLIDVLTCDYGEGIDEDLLPQIPEKEGYYSVWSRTDFSCITEDESVTAEYTRYITLLTSEQTRDGVLSVIAVDGQFKEGDALTVTSLEIDETNEYEIERWTVTIPDDGQQTHTIRFLISDDVIGGTIYILQDGVKTEVSTDDFGDYLIFEAEGQEVTIVLDDTMTDSLQGKVKAVLLIVVCIVAVVVVAAVIIRQVKKKRRKRKDQKKGS